MPGAVPPTAPANRVKRKAVQPNERSKVVLYALVSLASFLCATALLVLLGWKAETLTRLALIEKFYYPILVSFGLCAAVFLFGVLHSYASYRGRHLGGVLQLGGPAVVFALVIAGGRVMVPNAAPFALAIYVHGPGGYQDLVSRNSGEVLLDLDERVAQQVGDKGQAVFPAIPPRFLGQEVPVLIQSDAYELAQPEHRIRLIPPIVYLEVKLQKGQIDLWVTDQKSHGIAGAEIRIEGELIGKTDRNGKLYQELSLRNAYETPTLYVTAEGYKVWSRPINPTGKKPIQALLQPER
jgi:hypothetical protein